MDELKKLYLAPEAQILCFKPIERLAAYGDGVVDGDDIVIGAGPSGGEGDYDEENGDGE